MRAAAQIAERTEPAPAGALPRKHTARSMIEKRLKSAACILGHALAANIPAGWGHCADHWAERLKQNEIFGIAFAALSALAPDTRQAVFDLAHWGQMQPRMPMPSWGNNPMADARWWVRFASLLERKAYALASFESLPPKDRAAFLAHVTKETP